MNGRVRLKMAALLAAAICVTNETHAQNREKAWEVTPYLGTVQLGNQGEIRGVPTGSSRVTVTMDDDFTYGFRFGYHFTKNHMIEFGFGGAASDGMVAGTPGSARFQADILTGRINYLYNFFLHRRDIVVAFVTGGVGVANFSTFGQSADPDMQLVLETFVGDSNELLYNYGGGIRLFGSEKVGVRLDLRQFHYSDDARGSQNFRELTLGVTLVLGGA